MYVCIYIHTYIYIYIYIYYIKRSWPRTGPPGRGSDSRPLGLAMALRGEPVSGHPGARGGPKTTKNRPELKKIAQRQQTPTASGDSIDYHLLLASPIHSDSTVR